MTQKCVIVTATLCLLTLLGCDGAVIETADYTWPTLLAKLQDTRINEASGIASSRKNDGMYYINNDSGDSPRVFLVDREGITRAEISLTGASHFDYEDIAMAPGAADGEFDVCVADIGDNYKRREFVTIYRFSDIDCNAVADAKTSVPVTAYRVKYPDGARDAEAFAVEPTTGDGYIFAKNHAGGEAGVYRMAAPWQSDEIIELEKVATMQVPGAIAFDRQITGADISPDGTRIAIRTYFSGWEWSAEDGFDASSIAALLQTPPKRLTLAHEIQAEAVAYSADGNAMLTVKEKVPTYLWEVQAK